MHASCRVAAKVARLPSKGCYMSQLTVEDRLRKQAEREIDALAHEAGLRLREVLTSEQRRVLVAYCRGLAADRATRASDQERAVIAAIDADPEAMAALAKARRVITRLEQDPGPLLVK